MLNRFLFALLVLTIAPCTVAAATLQIDPTLILEFALPGEHWLLSREAPVFLVEETVEHLGHELAEQGKSPAADVLRQAAVKRLQANEAFLCHAESQACLLIDFSPLGADEDSPSRRAVSASARYAGESLEGEEGIADVSQSSSKFRLDGATSAYRVDASFRHHDEQRRFIGIVGFRHPYWIYLYYTDPLKDSNDYGEMDAILGSLVLREP